MIEFIQHSSTYYQHRTLDNIKCADITIAIAVDPYTAGEKCTAKYARQENKTYRLIVINNNKQLPAHMVDSTIRAAQQLSSQKNGIHINIAGNGIYTLKKFDITQKEADNIVEQVIQKLIDSKIKILSIRSGGQTGIDESGLKVADKLGIKAICLAPKGWRFRDINNIDIYNEIQFKSRYNKEHLKRTAIKNVQMFTCYWGFHPMLERNKYYHVSISCATPKNLQADFQLNEAKPDWNTVKRHKDGVIDDAQYYIEYLQKLRKNKDILAKRLVDIHKRANGKKIVFYCYELPDKFCHRHIFAKIMNSWFNNLKITEYHI